MEGGPVVGGRRFAVLAERRILVAVHGSLGSLQALRYAAEQARHAEARLVAVVAWGPPRGDLAGRRQPVYSLRQLWSDGAPAPPAAARGRAGPVLGDAADRPGDLLVVGTGRRGLRRWIRRLVSRYCLAHA